MCSRVYRIKTQYQRIFQQPNQWMGEPNQRPSLCYIRLMADFHDNPAKLILESRSSWILVHQAMMERMVVVVDQELLNMCKSTVNICKSSCNQITCVSTPKLIFSYTPDAFLYDGQVWIKMKKRSEIRKHCALAVVRRSQKYSPHRRPFSAGAGRPKFNQLEMVTTFNYKPSLVRIDACNFELSW